MQNNRISHYQLISEIGAGGLGRVFKALDTRTGRTVAIKFLHDRIATNKKFIGLFHKELLIVSRLHHKNIVQCLDASFRPPYCFIVSEFIDGWSGHQFKRKTGVIPPLVALSMLTSILQGLDYLHLHDVMHADLSAANILIDKSGRVMLTDFGLAVENSIEDYKGFMIGTPGYYSPEHISEVAMGPYTDVYCAGLLLHEFMTGTKAVPASQDRKQTLKNMRKISFDINISQDKKLNQQMIKILKKSLHRNYKRRYKSAEQMLYACLKLMKLYRIKYARYAIKQYLSDREMIEKKYEKGKQNIYYGAA